MSALGFPRSHALSTCTRDARNSTSNFPQNPPRKKGDSMAEKVPIYPVEGTIWDTLRDYEIHHIKQTEAVQRATLGLSRDEALPRSPIDTPFPRMVYREGYFSEQAPDQKVKHYKLVQNEEEASKAAGGGCSPLRGG